MEKLNINKDLLNSKFELYKYQEHLKQIKQNNIKVEGSLKIDNPSLDYNIIKQCFDFNHLIHFKDCFYYIDSKYNLICLTKVYLLNIFLGFI